MTQIIPDELYLPFKQAFDSLTEQYGDPELNDDVNENVDNFWDEPVDYRDNRFLIIALLLWPTFDLLEPGVHTNDWAYIAAKGVVQEQEAMRILSAVKVVDPSPA